MALESTNAVSGPPGLTQLLKCVQAAYSAHLKAPTDLSIKVGFLQGMTSGLVNGIVFITCAAPLFVGARLGSLWGLLGLFVCGASQRICNRGKGSAAPTHVCM